MKRIHLKNDLEKGFFSLGFLFLVIFSHTSYSIELSELKVNSLLNAPLDAKIEISNAKEIKIQSLIVSVADRDLYAKEGLEPLDWIYTIDVGIHSDLPKEKIIIELTTREPVKDPFADLIIMVVWEEGSIVKEYMLLLDPPKIAVPETLAPQHKKIKQVKEKNQKELGKVATLIKQRSFDRRLERARTRIVRPGNHYTAGEEESLWNIAGKLVKNTPYSVTQGIAALTYKNPNAFKDGNFNSYQNKAALELPTIHDIASFTEEDAQYFIDAQNEVWEQEYMKASQASALEYIYPESIVDAQSTGVKPLRLVSPELEGASSDTLDALKRTQESIIQNNHILKEQNLNLAELLAQKEKEIEALKSEKSIQLEELNKLPPPSAGEFSPYSRSSSVKIMIAWLIIGTILFFLLAIGFVLLREEIQAFIKKWKYVLIKKDVSNENNFVEAFASFSEVKKSVLFDIEKALSLLGQEEKRPLNLKNLREKKPDEAAVLQEVNGLIAYEKYGQAKKILRGILTNNPKNWDAVLMLLELYVMTESYGEFETECLSLPADLNEQAFEIWSKIEILKNKVNDEKPMKSV